MIILGGGKGLLSVNFCTVGYFLQNLFEFSLHLNLVNYLNY